MKTTNQEQNELCVKVAKLCGWKVDPNEEDGRRIWWINPSGERRYHTDIPDYPNDLNACARFETIALANGYAVQYADNLAVIITEDSFTQDLPASNFALIHSTAKQRCRAFVKTMEGK